MTNAEHSEGGDNRRFDNSAQLTPNPESPVGEFNYYAWGKLGRLVLGDHFMEAYGSTPSDQSFVYLDGCSSTPWLREVMRAQVARRVVKQADKIIRSFDLALGRRVEGTFPNVRHVRQEKINMIRDKLFVFRREDVPQKILQAAIFELLFDPQETVGVMTKQEESLKEYFLTRFSAQPAHFLREQEEAGQQEVKIGDPANGKWRTLVIDDIYVSFADIVGTLTEIDGPERLPVNEAKLLLDSMAKYFAHQVAEVIGSRPKFISLDLERADTFRRFAYRNFPLKELGTKFFQNVLDARRHKVGDVRDLTHLADGSTIEDETVSVYSMIEGFPFTADFNQADALRIISEAKRVLRIGGKFIVFPWATIDGRDLSSIETALQALGFEVKVEEKKKSDLLASMGERELALVRRSPVFQFNPEAETLPLLVATKIGT